MPRFRPFKGSPTPDCSPLTDAVEVVNGKRYLTHSLLDKELPSMSFYDLEKLVDSNDAKLEAVNPVLFPATHMSFDISESSDYHGNPYSDLHGNIQIQPYSKEFGQHLKTS